MDHIYVSLTLLTLLVARDGLIRSFVWDGPVRSKRLQNRILGHQPSGRTGTGTCHTRRHVLSKGFEQEGPPPYTPRRRPSSTSQSSPSSSSSERSPPLPVMPSDLFRRMAQSQLELLANSLSNDNNRDDSSSKSKVQSMILYLPQENAVTGQLEFTPAVLYPDPNTERVFIASDAASGQAPTLPKILTKLPGFSHASTLLPGYPMLSPNGQSSPGVGAVEEVLCDIRFKTAALSIPLLSGSQTVGVLLVSPVVGSSSSTTSSTTTSNNNNGRGPTNEVQWTQQDREQVSRAAQSLSMALMMDKERNFLREQNIAFREGLSDSLHQVKNPIQALRTYGKILQRQIVETRSDGALGGGGGGGTPQLLELAERLMVQSERVVDLLGPMDSLVETLDQPATPFVLLPAAGAAGTAALRNGTLPALSQAQSMVLWQESPFPYSNNDDYSETTNSTFRTFGDADSTRMALPQSNGQPPLPSSSLARSSSRPFPVTTDLNVEGGRNKEDDDPQHPPLSSTVVGDYDVEMTFVTDVLEPVLETFYAIATEGGIILDVRIDDGDDLPGVMAAPRSLQESVSNVLDNALKYVVLPKADSPFTYNPNPQVRVRIFPNSSSNNGNHAAGVTILVEDNGPGVAEDDYERIFERGYRGERTSTVEGRGIGLDISRALIGRMGGSLSLAREEDKFWDSLDGTVMKFMLFRKPRL